MEKIAITSSEVSKILGISEMTVYRLAKKGELPGRKVGRCWRFSKLAIEKWLQGESWQQRLEDFLNKIWAKTEKIPENKMKTEIKESISEVRKS